ncbi:hypothetical protein Acid345_4082 [Candidatus Koribacter versatilis Ellin345]|uniref:DUF3943 domain-containing protein n=1 Tax=Koribacter versatilis (strain Ellin345) TaxID=204669 RepID=Q1IJ68_KORVE|nr:hypothetical protein [Candidatus Koribacter versatilis]ABF43082.1 hypothetical protein Acid345_4082 [Candidatus Koribacter versatilis Ellin345]
MNRLNAILSSLLIFGTLIFGASRRASAQEFVDTQSDDQPTRFSFVYDDARETSMVIAGDTSGTRLNESSSLPNAAPIFAVAPAPQASKGVDWKHLFSASFTFLAAEHTFRVATEPSTRIAHHQAFVPGYGKALGNLHGWGDGDAFLINYVGHPMQGAVSGFMWQHNDRAYRNVEFGRNRDYWRERMRGMAFAYLYSVQFEIGPISEASIGHVQSWYPQVGFVDHVITPTIGTGWAIGEDAIDRKVIQPLEHRIENPLLRVVLRGGLNPARSFANMMGGQVPWSRDDRPGVFRSFSEREAAWSALESPAQSGKTREPEPGVAPFEFSFDGSYRTYLGGGQTTGCIGGGGVAAFRLSSEWQMLGDVGGCKLLGFKDNWSGDSLTYLTGPRWTPQTNGKWVPHVQALVGGTKITQSYEDPILKAEVADWPTDNDETRYLKHAAYTKDWDAAGFAVQAGAGVDYRFNNALELHVANLEYTHAWIGPVNGANYRNSVQFSYGLVLRMGTW